MSRAYRSKRKGREQPDKAAENTADQEGPGKGTSGMVVKIVLGLVLVAVLVTAFILVYPSIRLQRALATISRGTDTDRKWAAMEIADYGDEAVPRLLVLMKTGDDKTGRYAAMALARIGDLDESLTLIKSKRAQTRINAIRVLARAQNGAARQAVVESLQDADADVRRVACEWIGLSRIKEAFHPLLEVISDSNSEVREKAAISLGKISDPEKIPVLVDLCASSEDAKIRETLVEILTSEAFASRANEVLEDIQAKSKEAVRSAGLTYVRLAERIGGPMSEEITRALLEHADSEVRAAAVRGAVKLHMRDASAAFVRMLLTDEQKPCEAATRGLLDFGARGHEGTIFPALQSADEFRRYCGLRVLEMTAKTVLIKPAIELLDDSSRRVRKAAHAALMAAVKKKYNITPRVEPTKSSWSNWFEKIEKEMAELRTIDEKIAEIRRLLSARTEYKRAEALCREAEADLSRVKGELIATPPSHIENKITLLTRMRYQAFKFQPLKAR